MLTFKARHKNVTKDPLRFRDDFVSESITMISIQALLGKDDKFMGLLEASAAEGVASADALKSLLAHSSRENALQAFLESREKDKSVTSEINALLARTFVTTLEREDIQALSHALYRIPKTIQRFAERFLIYRDELEGVSFDQQVSLMNQASSHVEAMVRLLRKANNLEAVKEANEQLQQIEGEADTLMLNLLRDLYSGRRPIQQVIILKDLYELLEKAIDRCRDAGNVITHIVLKQS